MKHSYSKPIIYKTSLKLESDLCAASVNKRGHKVVKDHDEIHIMPHKGFDEHCGRITITEFDKTCPLF